MKKKIAILSSFILLNFLLVSNSFSEEPTHLNAKNSKHEPKEKVHKGVISSSGHYVSNTKVDSYSTEMTGESKSVITGSVSHSGKNECVAKVFNSSPKNKYSVSFKVIGKDKRGVKALSRGFSAVIKPGSNVSRSIKNCKKSLNLSLSVVSAKSLGGKK